MYKKIFCAFMASLLCVFSSFSVFADFDMNAAVNDSIVGSYNDLLGKLMFGGAEIALKDSAFHWKCPDCGYVGDGNMATNTIKCPGCGVELYDPHKDLAIAGESLHKHWLVVADVSKDDLPVDSEDKKKDPSGYIAPGFPLINKDGEANEVVEFVKLAVITDSGVEFVDVTLPGNYGYVFSGSLVKSFYPTLYAVITHSIDGTYSWVSQNPPICYGYDVNGTEFNLDLLSYGFLTMLPSFTSRFSFSRSGFLVTADTPVYLGYQFSFMYVHGLLYQIPQLTYKFTPFVPDGSIVTVNNITTINNTTITGDTIYKDTTNNIYYSYTDNACTVYYVDDSNKATTSVTYNEGDENYYVTVYQPVSVTPTTPPSPTTPPGTTDPISSPTPGPVVPVPTLDPDAVYNVNVLSVGEWFTEFATNISEYFNTLGVGIAAGFAELSVDIKGYFSALAGGIAAGFADLSANFTLAIDKLSINIENTFNKYMGTPETALPSATPGPSSTPAPSATPEPDEPIVIDKQPVDVSIKTGTNVKYSVEAHSTLDSELSYLWEWSADDGESWRVVSQKAATITTGTNMSMNGRIFRCTISDTLGNSVVSTSALLQVWETEPPEPTATPAPTATPVPSLAPGQTPAPSASPAPPLDDAEKVDSIFLDWLRHIIDGAAAATAPLEEVGGTFVEFFAMLPDEVKATLTGALCILLAAGMWKFFGG